MESQAIKEYDDFAGQDGYVIVDGLDEQTPGGKKLLSTIGGGGYNVVRLAPTTADLINYEGNYWSFNLNAQNNTLYFIDLNGTKQLTSPQEFEKIVVNLPEISNTEYYDVVIQTKGTGLSDYKWEVYYTEGVTQYTMECLDNIDNTYTSENTECKIFGEHYIRSYMATPGGD